MIPVVWSERHRLHEPGGEVWVGDEAALATLHAAGRLLGELRLPTVVVQEGGYDLDSIGPLVREALSGLEEGLAI